VLDEAQIIASFSQRLKTIRRSNNLTLDELSQKSGVSISTISKIENQQQKPSFETVLRVSRALQINFLQMLETPELPQPNIARRAVTRAAQAPRYASEYYDYEAHATEISHKKMTPLIMHVKSRALPPLADWSIHDGEEFLYVLEGAVELHSEHYAPALLKKGDSCFFDSTMRHAYVRKSGHSAKVLAMCLTIVPFPE
jgi:transcriptional regulator with XRE-family HTH domain